MLALWPCSVPYFLFPLWRSARNFALWWTRARASRHHRRRLKVVKLLASIFFDELSVYCVTNLIYYCFYIAFVSSIIDSVLLFVILLNKSVWCSVRLLCILENFLGSFARPWTASRRFSILFWDFLTHHLEFLFLLLLHLLKLWTKSQP